MNEQEQRIDQFFDRYRDVFNKALKGDTPDVQATAALFSACFVAADPSGVNCGQNDRSFGEAMKSGYAFYRRIGMVSMDIVSKAITLLDGLHAMARIRWRSGFVKNDGQETFIEFENIYLVQTRDGSHKVFAYITGDEQAALKKAGLPDGTER